MKQGDDTQHRDRLRCAGSKSRVLVEAGPGTGKTEMAAIRIQALIRSGLCPGQILVLSFSRSAVRTLTQRLSRVAGTNETILEELRHISIRTFDSWAFRILRQLGYSVQDLLSRSYEDNIAELTEQIQSPRKDEIIVRLGDLRHLIVDEFQDLPGVRGDLVLALMNLVAPPSSLGTGFTVLGDPAQAIYGFAGKGSSEQFSRPSEYWKSIVDNYGGELEKLTLYRNYRATEQLADISTKLRNVLISNRKHEEKLEIIRNAVEELPSPSDPVGPKWLNSDEPASRAILTRTNGQGIDVLKKIFGQMEEGGNTPVLLRAGHQASLSPAWIAALLRKLRSTHLTRSQFSRIYAHLVDQWDKTTQENVGLPSEEATWSRLARASSEANETNAISILKLRTRLHWPDAFPDDQWAINDGITVTTIHQSKGQEFDIVTLLDTNPEEPEGQRDYSEEVDGFSTEEENVNYVAITRAGRELNRIDGTELYNPPRYWTSKEGHRRLISWRGSWVCIEMGLKGDIDPFGFVDPAIHGGPEGVEKVQDYLLRNARNLEGHKVMLCKHAYGRKNVVWHIHIQESGKQGHLIGRTTNRLTRDLLDRVYKKGYILPSIIWNLRISHVGTVTSEKYFPLVESDSISRLWLGISLFGTGDIKLFKRSRKKRYG